MTTLVIPLITNSAGDVIPGSASITLVRRVGTEYEPTVAFTGNTPLTEYEHIPLETSPGMVELTKLEDILTVGGEPVYYEIILQTSETTDVWHTQLISDDDPINLPDALNGQQSWQLLTQDERDALSNASDPHAGNPLVTLDDIEALGGGHDPVTLDTAFHSYLSISGQAILLDAIDLENDVKGNLPVSKLDGGTNANAATYWRGDGTWAAGTGGGGGGGDVYKVGTPVQHQVGVWVGDGTIQGLSALTFNSSTLALNGNFTAAGTINYRNVSLDGSKLDTIEENASADQTGTEMHSAISTYLGQMDWSAPFGASTGTATEGNDARLLSSLQKGYLTEEADTTLHFHAADRARANHSGTQTLATISDAGSAAAATLGIDIGNVVALIDIGEGIPGLPAIDGSLLTGVEPSVTTAWLSGDGAPADGIGSDGDFYLDLTNDTYYGPKAAGTWAGTGPVNMTGPQGIQGEQGEQGIQGEQGLQGDPGDTGAQGAPGLDGRTWLSGGGAPGAGVGEDGDFYLDLINDAYYGPKAAGTWAGTGPVNMTGPQGIQGEQGLQGDQGVQGEDGVAGSDGKTWLSGNGAPGDVTGTNGDFYLDLTNDAYYGPKAGGTWTGTGPTSLIGPQGIQGEQGDTGLKGDQGDPGPSAHSTDLFNALIIGTDSLLLAPLAGTGSEATIARSDHNHDAAYDPINAASDAITAHKSTNAHTIAQITGLQTALDGKLGSVEQDTDPTLGGHLKIGGANEYDIIALDDAGATVGGMGYTDGIGVFLAWAPGHVYNSNDGGIVLKAGTLEVHGSSFSIDNLTHTDTTGRVVYVASDGQLYGVAPPDPGWSSATMTDANDYTNLGDGTDEGPWVQLVDTAVSPNEDLAVSDRLDVQARIYCSNPSGKQVSIEVAYGINGAEPTMPGNVFALVDDQVGYLPPITFSTTLINPITTSDTVSIWVRRSSGEHKDSEAEILGTSGPAELTISVPGGGGSITPTDLTADQSDADNIVIENSTGQDATIVPATNTVAGGMSATDKAKLDKLGTAVMVTADRAIAMSDNGMELVCNSASPIVLTMDAGLPIDFEVLVTRLGEGTVTINPDVSDYLNGAATPLLIDNQYQDVRIRRYI